MGRRINREKQGCRDTSGKGGVEAGLLALRSKNDFYHKNKHGEKLMSKRQAPKPFL